MATGRKPGNGFILYTQMRRVQKKLTRYEFHLRVVHSLVGDYREERKSTGRKRQLPIEMPERLVERHFIHYIPVSILKKPVSEHGIKSILLPKKPDTTYNMKTLLTSKLDLNSHGPLLIKRSSKNSTDQSMIQAKSEVISNRSFPSEKSKQINNVMHPFSKSAMGRLTQSTEMMKPKLLRSYQNYDDGKSSHRKLMTERTNVDENITMPPLYRLTKKPQDKHDGKWSIPKSGDGRISNDTLKEKPSDHNYNVQTVIQKKEDLKKSRTIPSRGQQDQRSAVHIIIPKTQEKQYKSPTFNGKKAEAKSENKTLVTEQLTTSHSKIFSKKEEPENHQSIVQMKKPWKQKSLLPKDTTVNTDISDTKNNNDFSLVAAIDFGTTYSGYAFLSRDEYSRNPMSVTAKMWSSPNYNSLKTPTSILFDCHKQFHSFGFEAESKYLHLLEDEDGDADDWYYFTHFKMILYQNTNIGSNSKLRDSQGKQMSAIKVFSAAIEYLKEDMLAMCYQQHLRIGQENIRWVITVPALWNDKAKTFMREAANKAGIHNNNLIMALEPEAASLYCIECMRRSDATELGRGEKFMVLDAGGGTVDIAVHQIQDNGRIRELHKANGGDWGGIKVDYEFKRLLKDIIGRDILTELEQQHKSDYLDIFYSFERAKRRDFSIVGHGKVQLTFPSIINRLCLKIKQKDVNEIISENNRLKNNVRLIKDKLEIDLTLFKTLFTAAIKDILNHLSILIRQSQVRDLTTILMVGGYSECYLLQEAIRNKFDSLKVIVPHDSVLSVLKGAVLYGHSPRTFQSRISTFTYGIETTEPFTKGHPLVKKICINGKFHCDNIFCIHVKDGENVTLGKSVSKTYKTIDPEQTHMDLIVFASVKKNPQYTDEDGCFRLGTLTVDVSNIAVDKHGIKTVKLELIYGGTELEAVATDTTTGKTSREHFILGSATRVGMKN